MRSLRRLLGARAGRYLALLAGTAASSVLMAALNPLFLKFIFDEGVIRKDFGRFLSMTAAFIAAATLWRLLGLRLSLATQRLKNDVLADVMAGQLRRFYAMPYGRVLGGDPGYHASRVYDEPCAAVGGAVDLGLDLVSSAVNAVAAFAVIVSVSPSATVALGAVVPLLVLLAKRFGARIHAHTKEESEEEGALRGLLSRAAEAYRSVRLFGLHEKVEELAGRQAGRFLESQFRRTREGLVYGTASSVLSSYAETLVLVVCGYEMLKGAMTFGDFMCFMNAFWVAMGGMRSFISLVPDVARTAALLDRLEEVGASAEAGRVEPAADGVLRFEDVGFSYQDKPVLAGLRLEVGRGEAVLLSGVNGCGKSTAANLAAGFLEPSGGRVATFPQERISACVSPHGFIPGTVRDNLGYDALDAAGRRRADGLLEGFGLGGLLDRDPAGMSAGQRKKVEVAMGLLKEADLYIFDEPLANVDEESKEGLVRSIFEATKGKSLVVVMHGDDRLKARFDRTVVLAPAA